MAFTEDQDRRPMALEVWGRATARDGVEVTEQFVHASVGEEEPGLAGDDGFGEAACAAADGGHTTEDGFWRDEADGFGPE